MWPVIEIFGPTFQGEGMLAGVPTHFLRLGGCGYRCTWCDTMYAVDPQQVKENRTMMTSEDICIRLNELDHCDMLTLSGGDPCLHHNLGELIVDIRNNGGIKAIAVETQGEFYREWLELCDWVTISPKPPSSGMESKLDKGVLIQIDDLIQSSSTMTALCFKFVAQNYRDIEWVYEEFAADERFDEIPFWIQPVSPPQLDGDENETYNAMGVVRSLEFLANSLLQFEKVLGSNARPFLNREAGLSLGVQLHRLMFPKQSRGV